MNKNKNIVDHPKFTVELMDDNVYSVYFKQGCFFTLKDIKEAYETYKYLGKNQPLKVIMDVGKYVSTNFEGRKYIQANKIPAIAEAIVIPTLPLRILFSFYTKNRLLTHPLKVFKSKSEALEWIKTI